MAIKHADEGEVKRPKFLPEEMSDADVHDLEFTVAFDSEQQEKTEQAPMLDALTSFREGKLN